MGWEGSFRRPPSEIQQRVNLLFGGGVDVWPSIEQRWALAKAAARISQDLYLESWYRDPQRNVAVGGVPLSQHQLGLAWDVRLLDANLRERLAEALRAQGFWVQEKPRGLHAQVLTPEEFRSSGAAELLRVLRRAP